MKQKWLALPIIILVFVLFPISFLFADGENLIVNGDFNSGADPWEWSNGVVTLDGTNPVAQIGGPSGTVWGVYGRLLF